MILGRFYFKQTLNGNLLGEFSNYMINQNTTESADLISEFDQMFIGNYRATWFGHMAESLDLEIRFKSNENNRIYSLIWSKNQEIIFIGEGFLVDNILIGDYRDDELEQVIGNLINS